MAKKVVGYIKFQLKAGQASPSLPVGAALSQRGLNIMEFCKAFNAATQKLEPGLPVSVVVTVYTDRSFTFITNVPPAVLRKAGKGSLRSATGTSSKQRDLQTAFSRETTGRSLQRKAMPTAAESKVFSFGSTTTSFSEPPAVALLKRNVLAGQKALKRAKKALTTPGVDIGATSGIPLFEADPKTPSVIIRVLDGKRERGKFVKGKFVAQP